jgi:hypothetical protein
MSTVDNNRPPYVTWETRPVEDRNASIASGHYVSKDVEYAIITRPGSRDTLDKEALVWLGEIREKCRKGDLPPSWYEGFKASYDMWKTGETAPVTGTPIKGWPPLSPAAQKDLIAAGIRTVEDLAEFSDSELSVIGTGAMSFKQKAQAWLKAANDTGKVAEQLAVLTGQVTELTSLVKTLTEENKSLRAQLPKPALAKA